MKPFEAHFLPGGEIQIFHEGWGDSFLLSSKEGFSFAEEYIADLRKKYPYHITAVELKIKQDFPDKYKQVMANRMLYIRSVSGISLSCAFGMIDHIPDRDQYGRYHFEFVSCPCRSFCRFNGYNPKYKDSNLVICNPIVHLGFTKTEKEIAELLVEGVLSLAQIATIRHVTLSAVNQIAGSIYKKAGVSNRKELSFILENQRIK